jgi:hypothetical protein
MAAATSRTMPARESTVTPARSPRARKLSTSELLERAYGVVADGSPADEEGWWATIWPLVKRVESRLRRGEERGDPGDERRLVKATNRFLAGIRTHLRK